MHGLFCTPIFQLVAGMSLKAGAQVSQITVVMPAPTDSMVRDLSTVCIHTYIYICIYIGIFSIYHCYTGKVEAVPLSMASLALGILGLNLPLHGLVLILLLLSVLIVGPSCPLPRGPPPIVRAPAFVPRVAPSLGLSLLPGLLLLEGFQQCTLASPRSTLDRTLYVEASLAEFYTYEACKVYRYVFMYMYSI